MSVYRLACAAAFALALAACNKPAGEAGNGLPELKPSEVPASVAELDKQVADAATFITAAAQANELLTEASRLAVDRAGNPDVKAFAQNVLDTHATQSDTLFAAAGGAAIALPSDKLDETHLRALNDLEASENAAAFDGAYAALAAGSLKEAEDLHEAFVRDGKIEQVHAYAQEALTSIKDSAAKAQKLRGAANP